MTLREQVTQLQAENARLLRSITAYKATVTRVRNQTQNTTR